MTQRVRVGVIGTSWWADAVHLPALHTHPQAELAAICGRSSEPAAQLAAKYGIPQVYASYREMLARAELDAVVIATPDDLHYQMAMDALAAGVHVLCEKPLAQNAAQARAMYEAAEASGLVHMVFFTYRWMPAFRHLKALLDEGRIGRPCHADFRFLMGFARDGLYRWRFDRQRANGVLGDLGSHTFDLARWFLGEIAGVSARVATVVARPGVDGRPLDPANDVALLLLDFTSGAFATVQTSEVSEVAAGFMQLQVTLYGEHGTLEADYAGEAVRCKLFGAEAEVLPTPDALWGEADRNDPFDVLFKLPVGARLFVEAVAARRRETTPNFADGFYAQTVVDAALAAHSSGRRVEVIAPPATT